jgi:hypothetical protein
MLTSLVTTSSDKTLHLQPLHRAKWSELHPNPYISTLICSFWSVSPAWLPTRAKRISRPRTRPPYWIVLVFPPLFLFHTNLISLSRSLAVDFFIHVENVTANSPAVCPSSIGIAILLVILNSSAYNESRFSTRMSLNILVTHVMLFKAFILTSSVL